MDDLLDMIIADESPSQISDALKDVLYAKSAERVDAFRPLVANSTFSGEDQIEVEDEVEVSDDELETSDGV
jgi:ApbE superfamily uncharacterized protein (UPF0280 family)|tara:strand:- start:391 stop:603 length:213 start_codon:yes stop_codon:yes gene_type:complete